MTMSSTVLAMITSVALPYFVIGAAICKWESQLVQSSSISMTMSGNPHTFIQASMSCSRQTEEDMEAFGCNLMDYAEMKTWRGAGMHNQAHWNLIGGPTDKFQLGPWQLGETCAEYNIPDYCARAMLSELSTVYDGEHRYTSIVAALGVLGGAGAYEAASCGTQEQEEANKQDVFSPKKRGASCWNMVNDWKHLFCSGYNKCTCMENTIDQCHRSPERIQCCRDRFEEFLNSRSGGSLSEVKRFDNQLRRDVTPNRNPSNMPPGKLMF
mmetsp:Transcript_109342/g.217190  ORF Transcript_109342/g.217190 Transcript_109342/m.217190 type:complete len:268 (+) Transcript_109342:79-882(+)